MERPEPKVTVIVTPRERFGVAKQSLESLYEVTDTPFDLVYVDAGAPPALSSWIAGQAEARGFTHLKVGRVLTPNGARNAGVAAAKTDYVVFADNDVIFSRGWLKALTDCADETGAEVVAPMTCEGPELHAVIHQAGGKYAEDRHAFFAAPRGERHIIDAMPHQGERLEDLPPFERQEVDACEFHCVLARRDLFDRIGPLDEKMLATKEHLDFCMCVHEAGGKVVLEPSSIVTYLFPTRQHAMEPADFPFFLVRWSTAWQRRSLDHFRDKWGIAEDDYFLRRYQRLNWRRQEGVAKTIAKRLPLIGKNRMAVRAATRLLDPIIGLQERALVARFDKSGAAQA
jgi:GT2 family glycosyltransferase